MAAPSDFSLDQISIESVSAPYNEMDQAEVDGDNYKCVVESSSSINDPIKRSFLFNTLDQRIFGHIKMCQLEAAIRDAQEMISLSPDLATGYIHLGRLYSIQGKQQQVIKVYETALQNVTFLKNSSDFQQPDFEQEFIKGKKMAMDLINKRVDFTVILPPELSHSILSKLDMKSNIVCLTISKSWREMILSCTMAWSIMKVDNNDENTEQEISSHLLDIAANVHHLILATRSPVVYTKFFEAIKNGQFCNIQSFQLLDGPYDGDLVKSRMWEELWYLGAVQQIGNTLTRLKLCVPILTFIMPGIRSIQLPNLLNTCPNLIKLSYIMKQMKHVLDDDDIDETSEPQQQHPLLELELELDELSRSVMEPLLKRCGQLERFFIWNCTEDFMDLLDQHCPFLKILGYNQKEEEVMKLDDIKGDNGASGLRALYVSESDRNYDPEAFCNVMPIIHKNAATLQEIKVRGDAIYLTNETNPIYNKQLPNLKRLYYSMEDNHPAKDQLLQYISTCPSLISLYATERENLTRLINHLIELQPPLQALTLQIGYFQRDDDNKEDSMRLQRLIQHYALLSNTATTAGGLEHIALLEPSNTILTDQILETLADIKTLSYVDIYSLSPNITSNGLRMFFGKLSASNVTFIRLGRLDACLDEHIILLAESLQHIIVHVQLELLDNITEKSILFLVQNSTCLKSITLNTCLSIQDDSAIYDIAEREQIEYNVYFG